MTSSRRPKPRSAAPEARSAGSSVLTDAPHGSRPEHVYTQLRDLIVSGSLPPGSRIIETDIAGRLGVSRTPVREALQRLLQEGYVITSSGAQSRLAVAPLTQTDVDELLHIVGALEGLGARESAGLPLPDRKALARELKLLNIEFHRAARATAAMEPGRLYESDQRFHRRIVSCSAGPRLLALHDAVKPQAERYIRMYISMLAGEIHTSVDEHEAIIAAIEAGDAEAAERAVASNWHHAAERLRRVIGLAERAGNPAGDEPPSQRGVRSSRRLSSNLQ